MWQFRETTPLPARGYDETTGTHFRVALPRSAELTTRGDGYELGAVIGPLTATDDDGRVWAVLSAIVRETGPDGRVVAVTAGRFYPAEAAP